MNERLKTLAQVRATKSAELEALFVKAEEENIQADALKALHDQIGALQAELDANDEDIRREEALNAAREANQKRIEWGRTAVNALPYPDREKPDETKSVAFVVPKRHVTAFKGEDGALKAYGFGQFVQASRGSHTAAKWLVEHGAIKAGQVEADNTLGGWLVPTEWSTDIIDLTDEFGVFPREARRIRMTRDTMVVPRVTGRATTYWVGEKSGSSSNESNMTFDSINLSAKKLLALVPWSNDVGEDAIVDMGDFVARDLARQFAKKIDQAGFSGDGTSTYGNILGLNPSFQKVVTDAGGTWATNASNAASIVVAAGNAYSEITLANLHTLVSRCPKYALDGAKWYCSQAFYWDVMVARATAAGGVTSAEILGLQAREPRFLGFPVVLSEVLPKIEANSQFCAYFGNMGLGVAYGDRHELRLATSDEYKFASDEMTIRGTLRCDVNIHDIGDYNATAASRNPGPVGAIITAAS